MNQEKLVVGNEEVSVSSTHAQYEGYHEHTLLMISKPDQDALCVALSHEQVVELIRMLAASL